MKFRGFRSLSHRVDRVVHRNAGARAERRLLHAIQGGAVACYVSQVRVRAQRRQRRHDRPSRAAATLTVDAGATANIPMGAGSVPGTLLAGVTDISNAASGTVQSTEYALNSGDDQGQRVQRERARAAL
jgi:hypothetical protein